MIMISKETVKHIAKLARIRLGSDEIAKFQKELSVILDYIEQLKEVDISGVDLKKGLGGALGRMREDEVSEADIEEVAKLLKLAPSKKDNYLKTKRIL